eukprot:s2433_g9.t1
MDCCAGFVWQWLGLRKPGVDQCTGKAVQRQPSTPRRSRPSVDTAPPSPEDVLEEWEDEHQDGDDRIPSDDPERKYEDLCRHIQDRFEAARRQTLAAFDSKDWMTATLASSKALWMLELYPVEKRTSSWALSMSELLANRSQAHLKQMQWASAEDDCTRSLAMNPKAAGLFAAKVRYRRAMASEKLGHLRQSLEDAESVLRFNPGSEAMSAMRTRVVARVATGIYVQLEAAEDVETRHQLWKALCRRGMQAPQCLEASSYLSPHASLTVKYADASEGWTVAAQEAAKAFKPKEKELK